MPGPQLLLGASFQPQNPISIGALQFGMLVSKPRRSTVITAAEELIPGSNDSLIDVIGKGVTKIQGAAVFQSYQSLKAFEGAVGSDGVLVYAEEPLGVHALLVSVERTGVTPSDIQLADIEFWLVDIVL